VRLSALDGAGCGLGRHPSPSAIVSIFNRFADSHSGQPATRALLVENALKGQNIPQCDKTNKTDKEMKNYLITAALATMCFSCEHKETTVNPPAEHNDTTIIKEAPSSTEKKTETETKVMPGGTTTEKKETTETR
jgi:hypothetical protein